MRKMLFLSLAIFLIVMSAGAQDAPPRPLYTLLFTSFGAGTRYSTYYSDNQWRGAELRARVLIGNANGQVALPRWSGDGMTLFSTAYKPNSTELATTLYGLYLSSGAFAPLLDVINAEGILQELVTVEAVSPDGRYAWTRSTISLQTHLVNLETGQVTPSECPARVLSWLPEEVIITCTGELFSQPDIFSINLSTGARDRTLLPPPAEAAFAAFVTQGRTLENGQFMVGAFDSPTPTAIGLLDLDAYTGNYVGVGNYLQLNADQTYAAFYNEGRLYRLNMATLRLSDVGAADPNSSQVWYGDTLRFWRTQQQDGQFQIIRVEASLHSRTETLVYSGIKPTRYLFAPQGDIFVLEFQAVSSYVEIYKDGQLFWVSDAAYPGSFVTLPPPLNLPIAWSNGGTWLHLNYIQGVGLQAQTLSVNMDTGQTLVAIEERAIFMGASPDGRWWLLGINLDPNSERRDRLLAYNPLTDEVVEIAPAAIPLYSDFLNPDWAYLLWSPMIEG